ncbi:hypothetical protein COY52_06205 [Candidatus Desantisbacteria bacterium CG_4_10_14_0_8_um_filter_48_22]|uniref:Nucleotidyl transferase AbiEii/AbiGii toxin family protein n=1 Tax=Candidatus Desantisbacteria bacterium CG_4_10_14_0_8_um_filter_48_22 TaxID=1974543 RepID=A0A2M7SB89_9BACT|nr:MAG: hypothetical protein COY52_06205 [Candidatus Desantisbacteria bacterium CG_4_10_14_0_8_um_filter_48_22]
MLIDRENLRELIPAIASKYNFRQGIIEKDYYLTIILNNIELLLSNKLIFKGGTLLNKIHLNYHRLSEDLDFTYFGGETLNTRSQRSKAIVPIRERMSEFLKQLGLKSEKPKGEGFNNSTQYIFYVTYPSFITARDENIKIEVSLRQPPMDKPVHNTVKHFYQDPFTGDNLIPNNKILSLSFNEAVAEKLKAAITRKDKAVRDYYDLWHIAQSGFDFQNEKFIELLKKKLSNEGYHGDFRHDFGLNEGTVNLLHRHIETDLTPVIRLNEQFDLDRVFGKFNEILKSMDF